MLERDTHLSQACAAVRWRVWVVVLEVHHPQRINVMYLVDESATRCLLPSLTPSREAAAHHASPQQNRPKAQKGRIQATQNDRNLEARALGTALSC